jgi:broad specificity phosphatase PhoE
MTPWNEEGRVQGHVETSLSDAGRRQAGQTRVRLAGAPFTAAYASDLPRCMETAQLVLDSRPVPLRTAPELRELFYGLWEGRSYREIQKEEPERFAAMMADPLTFAPPEGEGLAELMLRVGRFVTATREAHAPEETLLVVGHQGSLRALLLTVLELPLSHFWRFGLRAASVSVLDVRRDGAILEEWNSTTHLEGPP